MYMARQVQLLWLQVEMWLHATSAAVNCQRLLDDGAAVLMEVSRKFTMEGIRSLAYCSGWFVQVTSDLHASIACKQLDTCEECTIF